MSKKKSSKPKKPIAVKPAEVAAPTAPIALTAPTAPIAPAKRMSALDAAAEVLKKDGQAMRTSEMIVRMAEAGLWESPAGKTPAATLYSAILREVNTKAEKSRFRKADRGKFEWSGI